MVYPAAGIAKSTGSTWDTSIVDKSSDWNAAYTHKTTEDGLTGLVSVNGTGGYSAKLIGTDVQAHGAKLDAIQTLHDAAGALTNDGSGGFSYVAPFSMDYPGAGVPISLGTSWTTSHANQNGAVPYTGTYAWDNATKLYVNVLDWGITTHPYSASYCNNMSHATAMAQAASDNQSAWNAMVSHYSGLSQQPVYFFPASALDAYYFSDTLNLKPSESSLLGCGQDATNIVGYNHSHAIIKSGGHATFIRDVCLHHLTAGTYGTFPTHISGQYGILMQTGSATESWEHIWIRDCGDSALRFDIALPPTGGMGPIRIANISADNTAGWYIEITNSVADMCFVGGGCQYAYGGICLTGNVATNCHFRDMDIELGTAANAAYSLILSDGNDGAGTYSHGSTFSGMTLSGSPGHGIYLNVVGGYTFVGGHVATNPSVGAGAVELVGGCERNTFIGGYWELPGGVIAVLDAAVRYTTFIGLNTGGTITDIAANKTVSINSGTCAGTNI